MKGMDIFCASQAATSIRLSMDEGSSSSPSSSSTIYLGGGGRTIDRYNPIIRDPIRLGKSFPVPSCSSQSPISPKPLSSQSHHHNHQHHQNKNVTVANTSEKSRNTTTNKKKKIKISSTNIKPTQPPPSDQEKRKSSGSITTNSSFANRKSWSCSSRAAAADFISPPGSSRYLLSDKAAFLISEDFDPLLNLQKDDQSTCAFKKPTPSSSSRSPDQVVVLRVSLHCRGCERKMRKHISRMEGVSSFNIDFAAKKVTVVGNVTPLGVLASVSKVKNAQIWTPASAAAGAVPSFSHTNSSEINKNSLATLMSS